ncbi:hypothetical protein V3C99_008165 [Haemonchus contortus]|uniref:Rhodanese domain-containing protein n=1 Tax=Haemonchus contortus TaxID=6289 RepID=A0A7I4YLQ7_HAECO
MKDSHASKQDFGGCLECRYALSHLCLINLKEAFDTVEREAVIDIRPLRENNFTNRTSPFYKVVIINVKREARQGNISSPELFSAVSITSWDCIQVKIDGHYLHNLRFADGIAYNTIELAGQVL